MMNLHTGKESINELIGSSIYQCPQDKAQIFFGEGFNYAAVSCIFILVAAFGFALSAMTKYHMAHQPLVSKPTRKRNKEIDTRKGKRIKLHDSTDIGDIEIALDGEENQAYCEDNDVNSIDKFQH